MSAPSTQALFRATKPKADPRQISGLDAAERVIAAQPLRDPLDFDPTPDSASRPFIAAEMAHIRAHGNVIWEPAVGAGHIARVLAEFGFDVLGNDVVDRGWPGTELRSFLDCAAPRAPIQITNPPYGLVSARDGHGRWLRHALDLGAGYLAMLLNADWAAARINGFDGLFREHPPSVEYLCCWKIDFRGGGSPPQRNSWFVWDANRPAPGPNEWIRRRLYREVADGRQEVML